MAALCCSLILQYLVPGAVIFVCYWRVFVALRRRTLTKRSLTTGATDSARASNTTTASRRREQQEIRRNHRTNRMLIAMVAIFIVCWLPLNVIILLLDYGEQQFGNWRYILLVFFVAHVVAMSSTVYNPFLYAWMNDAFRQEFQRVLPLCGAVGQSSSRTDDTPRELTKTPVTGYVRAENADTIGTKLTTFVDGGDTQYISVKVEAH